MSIAITVSFKKIYKREKINFFPDRLIMSYNLMAKNYFPGCLQVPKIEIGYNELS